MRRMKAMFAMLSVLHAAHPLAAAPPVAKSTAANETLPEPYVSRALKATVMPINGVVRTRFKLAPTAKGVIVVAVQPGGIADKSKIKPGDILEKIKGRPIEKPVDIDATVKYWGKKGEKEFRFDAYRDGRAYNPRADITLAVLDAALDVALVGSWLAWGSPYWSWGSYYGGYSGYLVESYAYSETYIEETYTSTEYAETSNTYAKEDAADDDRDGPDDTDGDGDTDSDSDDDGGDDDGGDDDGGDDAGSDDGGRR